MLNVTGGLKVYLAVEPADMRKGFGGLYALASEKMREDPRQGALFVFTNRDRNRVKLLHFDGTGLWVCVKRLEKGTFSWPAGVEVEAVSRAEAPCTTTCSPAVKPLLTIRPSGVTRTGVMTRRSKVWAPVFT